jgi:hypothetical protein
LILGSASAAFVSRLSLLTMSVGVLRGAPRAEWDEVHAAPDEVGRHGGQELALPVRPAEFDLHVLTHDITIFGEPLTESFHIFCVCSRGPSPDPITGIAGCCARATTGHAAALPSAAMNSRRRILNPRN